MSDVAVGLPVRTEADGVAGNLWTKIVDATSPATQQAQVDTDKALKVLATGHDGAGANHPILMSASGQVHVLVDSTSGDETSVVDYNTGAAVAASASSTHTYTVTTGKTLSIDRILCSASGRARYEIKVGPVGSELTKAVVFGTAATPVIQLQLDQVVQATSGQNVLVVRTNTDNQAQDVYSTIIGYER